MPAAPPLRTYVEENLDAFEAHPDRVSLVCRGRRLTAGEVRNLIHRMARALAAQGNRRGQTVTLLCGNLPEGIVARYAASLLGCRVSHLNNKLSAQVQANVVDDAETRVLIVDPAYAEQATAVTELMPVKTLLTLGPAGIGQDLLTSAAEQPADPVTCRSRLDDACFIRHSGRTTGLPKAIGMSFARLARYCAIHPRPHQPPVQLVCSTLTHGAGLLADVTLRDGGTVVLLEGFDAGTVLSAVEEEHVTYLFLAPPLLYQLLGHPDLSRTELSSLRRVAYGGSASPPSALRSRPAASKAYSISSTAKRKPAPSAGSPRTTTIPSSPNACDRWEKTGRRRGRFRDANGNDLPDGRHGEICVRSSSVMDGYWKRPDLTAKVLRNGWAHTGDLGYLDDDGCLTIVGRINDMIKVVGGHVSTTCLEHVLDSHPAVQQSAVFGVRDDDHIERIHAAVVPIPDRTIDAQELHPLVREERGPLHDLADITFLDALPLTEAGKPDKKLLQVQAHKNR
ncbi:AMP-binding protein [Streptomyces sp. NPDC042319]|uniref:AMP-binding protein n=1 Tax=Streptomyces sp. NPDC042319 TaxID=3154332 RepID=UPI0033D6B30A